MVQGQGWHEQLQAALPEVRRRRPVVEPVSRVHLTLHVAGGGSPFEVARNAVLKHVGGRAGGPLPDPAMKGETFLANEIALKRVEAISSDDPPSWILRFDDDDREIPSRKWVIETGLVEREAGEAALFWINLQCVARGENPSYVRSIPTVVRDVIAECDAKLDGRTIKTVPWIVDTNGEVGQLVDLLLADDRGADVVVLSLPERSSDPSEAIVLAEKLASDLAGAAHVVVLSGRGSFGLSDRVGKRFSVYRRAVRVYRPRFDPETDDPFSHPLWLPHDVRGWSGGPEGRGAVAFGKFLVSDTLRRTVEEGDTKRVIGFPELKRRHLAKLREKREREEEETWEGIEYEAQEQAEQEIRDRVEHLEAERDCLTADFESDREDMQDQLDGAEGENQHLRERLWEVREENQRLKGIISDLQNKDGSRSQPVLKSEEPEIPDSLDVVLEWAEKHLVGDVHVHKRAIRAAKKSRCNNIELVYRALLLLKDHYVPMKRNGGKKHKRQFDAKCKELGLKESSTVSGGQMEKHGDEYRIEMGGRTVWMDRHLKKGTSHDPRYCFRMYFGWENEMKQVVVGSFPSHLRTWQT